MGRKKAKPEPEPEPELEPVKDEAAECLKFMEDTLKQYKLESQIPIHHEYWNTCNRYRALTKP